MSRNCSLAGVTLTSPSVVLTAEKPGNNSASVRKVAGIATAISSEEKCILLSAPLAAKKRRYPSSPEKGDPCTVATATLELSPRPAVKKGNTTERRCHKQGHLLFFIGKA
jgi:hypothetical protein